MRPLGVLLIVLAASVLLLVGVASADSLPPGGTFFDDDGNVHEGNIEAIAAAGVTRGCNPPENNLYCPDSSLTRGQMAAFVRRALNLPSTGIDYFADDDDSVFEGDINAIAHAGITRGCNPPTSDRYCPDGSITREQMAAFLRRAFDYPAASTDYFTDDQDSIFEDDINAIAAAGVTLGCNPPANNRYCPRDLVKRDQMASFFSRALGLAPITPPAREFFLDGLWRVGSDIEPGLYRNLQGGYCSAKRLSGLSGSYLDVIESELAPYSLLVSIEPTDAAFQSDGCGFWTNDLALLRPDPYEDFGNGYWKIGTDVAAGWWTHNDESGCSWELLSGFSWAASDVSKSDRPYHIAPVLLADGYEGFHSRGCGTWTYLEPAGKGPLEWNCRATENTYSCSGDIDRNRYGDEGWSCSGDLKTNYSCNGYGSWQAFDGYAGSGLLSFIAIPDGAITSHSWLCQTGSDTAWGCSGYSCRWSDPDQAWNCSDKPSSPGADVASWSCAVEQDDKWACTGTSSQQIMRTPLFVP